METKKGKIKSIPVTEVNEGMQVIDVNNRVQKIKSINHGLPNKPNYTPVLFLNDNSGGHGIEYLKILVVEHEAYQVPFSDLDWQTAIDNGLVDNDQEVEIRICDKYGNRSETINQVDAFAILMNKNHLSVHYKKLADYIAFITEIANDPYDRVSPGIQRKAKELLK